MHSNASLLHRRLRPVGMEVQAEQSHAGKPRSQDVARSAGERWRALSAQEKAPFEEESAASKVCTVGWLSLGLGFKDFQGFSSLTFCP